MSAPNVNVPQSPASRNSGGGGGGGGGEAGGDGYVLQRNYFATSRLNLQYYLWQDTFRFHLHPSIPDLAPDAQIADIATGSGIWLLDLSEQVPSTTLLDGFDISLSQTPPTAWLPHNVRFHQYDLFSDPGDEFIGRFDVIHVRLIALVIKDNDASVIVRNLMKMLKPGGHLQWEEYHTEHSFLRHAHSPNAETPALDGLRRMMKDPTRGENGEYLVGPRDWLASLPSTLQADGLDFDQVDVFSYRERKCMAKFWSQMYILNFDELANHLATEGKDAEKEAQIREMARDAGEEVRKGGAIEYGKKVVVARRRGAS